MRGTRVETPSESVRNRTSCVYRVRKGRWECAESRPKRRGREEACQSEPERRWARASATEDEGWGGGWRRKAEDGGRAGLIAHMSDAGAAGRTSRALGCDTTVNSESEASNTSAHPAHAAKHSFPSPASCYPTHAPSLHPIPSSQFLPLFPSSREPNPIPHGPPNHLRPRMITVHPRRLTSVRLPPSRSSGPRAALSPRIGPNQFPFQWRRKSLPASGGLPSCSPPPL